MAQQYAKDQPSGFQNHISNIAIVGATGSVGEYLTKHLVEAQKFNVTAITREDSKSSMPAGVRTAKINYEKPETIVEALQGQQALIITMKTGQKEASRQLIEAAAKAKVQWIMPNEYSPDLVARPDMGNDSNLLPAVAEARAQIAQHGVSKHIGLFCGYWYEFSLANAPQAYGFDFASKTVTFMDDGRTRINTSTWEQCGRAVAKLFALPVYPRDERDESLTISRWANDAVRIQSFCVNQRDMLASVLRVTGDKEADWTIEYQPAKERWEQGRAMMKEGGAKAGQGYIQTMYSRVFFQDGSGDFSDRLDNERLGLPEESMDEATQRALKLVESGYNYFKR